MYVEVSNDIFIIIHNVCCGEFLFVWIVYKKKWEEKIGLSEKVAGASALFVRKIIITIE